MSISDLGFEEIFETKDHTAKQEKTLIGKYVASLVSENETVFLNSGSTTLEVVRHLAGRRVRVVTNNAACLLLDLGPNIELILLGGDYRPQSRSLVGGITIGSLQSIYSTLTVLGINGVSIRRGCTTDVQLETAVNKAMIENSSGKVVVAADHTKMNCVSSFLTCPLTRVDLLVTDWMTPVAFCDEVSAQGVTVHRVPQA
jgi:DeoR family fructose operon transcriptional repressor